MKKRPGDSKALARSKRKRAYKRVFLGVKLYPLENIGASFLKVRNFVESPYEFKILPGGKVFIKHRVMGNEPYQFSYLLLFPGKVKARHKDLSATGLYEC